MGQNAIPNVKTTKLIINAILVFNKYQFLLLRIKFSFGFLTVGGVSFVCAVYGISLECFIEESKIKIIGVFAVGVIVTT